MSSEIAAIKQHPAPIAGTGSMLQRPIPKTGELLPLVGCGTYLGFDAGEERFGGLANVLERMLDAGGSVVDSSPMYGRAERAVGTLIGQMGRREDAFLATKVWTTGQAKGIAQMERSLELLKTDHVDLMQVHNLVDVRTHLDTLSGWKSEGRTRYVGVTHYQSGAYKKLEEVLEHETLDFVQLNYSLEDIKRGVAVIVNVPFGSGALIKRFDKQPLPPFASDIGCTSWPQFLLKFVLGHPAVTCAIPGTANADHMAQNLTAAAGDLKEARQRILAWWGNR